MKTQDLQLRTRTGEIINTAKLVALLKSVYVTYTFRSPTHSVLKRAKSLNIIVS